MALSGGQIVSIVLAFFGVIRVLFPEFGEKTIAFSGEHITHDLYVWTFLTAGFYESIAVMILFDIAVTLAVGWFLEASSWSTQDFVRYVFQTNFLAMLSIFFTEIAVVGISRTTYATIFPATVSGFYGVWAAYSVALWQMGDLSPVPQVNTPLKYQHLPALTCVVSLLLCIAQGYFSQLLLTIYGIFYSWMYLRFLKKNPALGGGGGMLGDFREEFAFDAMFPAPLRPAVAAVTTVTLKMVNAVGFLKREPLLPITNPTEDDDDFRDYSTSTQLAEERRQLAIKAIDEKIAQIQSNMKKKSPSGGLQSSHSKPASSSLMTQQKSSSLLVAVANGGGDTDDEKEPLVKKVRRDAQAS